MKYCVHCGQYIQYHEIFGWYHGDMDGGWNTSCEGDETRADPGNKLQIERWQHDEIISVLIHSDRISFEDIWLHMRKTYEIRQMIQHGRDVPNVYVFYGYKQDAVKWRLEHNVMERDMVLARDYRKLEGRRGRPVVIGQDSEWSKHNWNHEFSEGTRRMVNYLESYYGSSIG